MISSPRIYLDQFLASPYTKAGLLIPLAIILTYLLARALIILSVSLTIGVIVREALPVFLALGLFLLIWASDLGSLAHSLTFRGFGLVHLGVLLAVAALTAFLVANYASLYNPTFSLISGLVLAGFLVSIFLALTSDGPEAVMPFLLAYPFLAYLEADWNFRDVLVNFLTLGPFSFTPTLIFICLLFLAIVFRKVATRQALTGTRLDLFVLGWLFLLFLSSLNSRLPEESLQEFLLDGIPVLLFFIVVNRVRTARDMIVLGASVLIASLLRLAVLYYFYRVLLRTEVDIGIVSSILKFGVHMGVLGWITHVTLPLSIAFFVILRDPRLRFA
ncbi:MAG: hypothetical protein HY684_06310, partial [Chloroflexi bacterium]|nr:hypothetical protein [Chloroflexota bacterium]